MGVSTLGPACVCVGVGVCTDDDPATVYLRGRVDECSAEFGGTGGEEVVAKVDASAVVGVSGMLTWASPVPSASPPSGSSFVRMADKFLSRGAMSSGTGPSTVVSRDSIDS